MKQQMTMGELQKEIIDTLKDRYPDLHITADTNDKGLPCITVKKSETDPAAGISLERLHDDILHGRSLDSVKDELTDILGDLMDLTMEVSEKDALSWESARGRIAAKLINKRAIRNDRISIPIGDLDVATVFDVRYGHFSTAVTPKLLETWDVDEETVKEAAEANAASGPRPVCRYMHDIVELADIADMSKEQQANASIVVTNTDSAWGANAILRPDVQSRVRFMLNGEDFFIIPSSVHETICIPKRMVDLPDLFQMVCQTNRAIVAIDDQLSDDVWDISPSGALISAVRQKATA